VLATASSALLGQSICCWINQQCFR